MGEKPIETIEYKGYQIKIYPDEYPISPRENDNLGTMVCKHRSYDLGDVQVGDKKSDPYFSDAEEVLEYVKRKDVVSLPLYLLDHSGLWMRTGKFACDSGGWDTSMVGFITVTHEKIKKDQVVKQITDKVIKKVQEILEIEVKEYSDYLEGNIVGYEIEKDGDSKDSCWGFYPEHNITRGRHDFQYMIDECKSIIDSYVKEDQRLENIQENVTSA